MLKHDISWRCFTQVLFLWSLSLKCQETKFLHNYPSTKFSISLFQLTFHLPSTFLLRSPLFCLKSRDITKSTSVQNFKPKSLFYRSCKLCNSLLADVRNCPCYHRNSSVFIQSFLELSIYQKLMILGKNEDSAHLMIGYQSYKILLIGKYFYVWYQYKYLNIIRLCSYQSP